MVGASREMGPEVTCRKIRFKEILHFQSKSKNSILSDTRGPNRFLEQETLLALSLISRP